MNNTNYNSRPFYEQGRLGKLKKLFFPLVLLTALLWTEASFGQCFTCDNIISVNGASASGNVSAGCNPSPAGANFGCQGYRINANTSPAILPGATIYYTTGNGGACSTGGMSSVFVEVDGDCMAPPAGTGEVSTSGSYAGSLVIPATASEIIIYVCRSSGGGNPNLCSITLCGIDPNVYVMGESCAGGNDGSIMATGVVEGTPLIGTLTFSIDGVGGSSANTTGVFTGLAPGNYTIIAYDSGNPVCQGSTTAIVPSSTNICCQAPVITCPSSVTVACGASLLPANTGSATYVNGCGMVNVTYSDNPTSVGPCGGTIIRTWTATDANNATSTCPQTIVVSPAPAASFTSLPGNTSIACGSAPPTGSSLMYSNGASGLCRISGSVTGVITGGPHNACGTVTTSPPYIETWTFTDACGRNITHSRTISVQAAPQATFSVLPLNSTVDCSQGVPSPSQLSYSNGQSGLCSITGMVTSTITLNSQACPTVYTERWIFTDACGRTIIHSRNIVVTVQWSNADIGNANGSANYSCTQANNGTYGPFTSSSAGYASPGGSATTDIMHYIFTQLSGDGQIIARFASATNAGFGGIMIRETLAPGSKKVDVRTQGNFNVEREVRFTTNGNEVTQQWPRYHKWLRLDRTGNVFNTFTSPDGVSWFFLGTTTVAMNQCIYIGVFAEGVNPTTSTTCVMDNIQVKTGTPVIPPPFGGLSAIDNQEVVDVAGVQLTPDISIYPNPASNNQEITLSVLGIGENKARVAIYSLQGVLVRTIWVDGAEANTVLLPASDFTDGLYLVSLITENNRPVSKILSVVQK